MLLDPSKLGANNRIVFVAFCFLLLADPYSIIWRGEKGSQSGVSIFNFINGSLFPLPLDVRWWTS
jgi:hypothetical protein